MPLILPEQGLTVKKAFGGNDRMDEVGDPIGRRRGEASEMERLEEGVKQIVSSRERTPRSPRWHRAWWRTLVRYNRRQVTRADDAAEETQPET